MKAMYVEEALRPESNLGVMNFLNEIAERYPKAISFASGRPAEDFFSLEQWLSSVPHFVEHYAFRNQLSRRASWNKISQYGQTKGIIADLIANQLAADEDIHCDEERIIVTAGCQEAMDLCVGAVCRNPNDTILAIDPSYIGITGAAARHGVRINPVRRDGDLLANIAEAYSFAEAGGERPRLLYLVPTFDNPTGTDMSNDERTGLLHFAIEKKILILEDNPYGMIRFDGERLPSLYEQDNDGCVIYCGTFSKTLCPALRVGFMLLPNKIFGSHADATSFGAVLLEAKSFVTVNTSQICQAVVGGVLLAENGSLKRLITPAVELYRHKRDRMLQSLCDHFSDNRQDVKWNVPSGGFFLVVTLPFAFSMEDAEICAREYNVLVMPVASFSLTQRLDTRVRLSFSYATQEVIEQGVYRFSRFVHDRLLQRSASV
jgi:(S)-3,5-dihydroxyphenylglycine transaminase